MRVGRRWTMRIGVIGVIGWIGVIGACGSEPTTNAPPPLSTGSSRPPDVDKDGGGESPDAFVLTPTETSKTYAGALATTSSVAFGGGGYCNYEITLRDVSIEIVVLASGDVNQAVVRDLAVEKALAGCPYAPMEPSIQDFAMKSAAVTTTGTHLEFSGAKANRPETSLVVDLVQTSAGYDATATWKRVDQGPPLGWTVTEKVSLVRK